MKSKKEELEAELTRLNALRKQVKEKLKALPVLEVGKWYWIENRNCRTRKKDAFIFIKEFKGDDNTNYGFDSIGVWTEQFWTNDMENMGRVVEATPQEVEKALIDEAKRRYKVGDVVISSKTKLEIKIESDYFEASDNYVSMGLPCVFLDGQWATIIERIKPEEKPKVGDWIKYENGGGTKIAKLTEKNIYSFDKPKFKYTIIKDCYMIDKLNNL